MLHILKDPNINIKIEYALKETEIRGNSLMLLLS